MIQKNFYLIFLLTPLTLTSTETEFNLSLELSQTDKTTNTAEQIAAFQNMAQLITKADSTRLSKKLVKLIKNLHTICYDDQDPKIRFAYKNLLEMTLANEKLKALDYSGELLKLLELYRKEPNQTYVQEDFEEKIDINEIMVEEIVEEMLEVSEKTEQISQLYENVQNLDRNEIVQKLSLRKILNDLTRLTRDFQNVENKIERLSDKNRTLATVYKKLVNIERLIKLSNVSDDLIRFPSEFEDFEEYSPLLQQLILEDLASDLI